MGLPGCWLPACVNTPRPKAAFGAIIPVPDRLFYMSWWSIAVALIVAALSERFDIVEHIWMPASYMYMAVCGFFFMAAWLPAPLRRVALSIDPPLHAYKMIRGGLWGNRVQVFYDIPYLSYLPAIVTLVGLWL